MIAQFCTLIQRGEVSRPGDHADKVFYKDKQASFQDQARKRDAKETKRKQNGLKGKSYRNKLLNEFIIETYGQNLRCTDVAGGSGDLTREILNQHSGCAQSSVVIDPRRDTEKCGKDVD